jgi:hypothetical protein
MAGVNGMVSTCDASSDGSSTAASDGASGVTPDGWNPSAQRDDSTSEQARQCMDLQHCLHWLHFEPTHLQCDTVSLK